MGLDMGIYYDNDENTGYELAYWRKHWPLHNYITAVYGSESIIGMANINLCETDIVDIIEAVSDGNLPIDYVDTFYYDLYDKESTIKQLEDVLMFIQQSGIDVYYDASW